MADEFIARRQMLKPFRNCRVYRTPNVPRMGVSSMASLAEGREIQGVRRPTAVLMDGHAMVYFEVTGNPAKQASLLVPEDHLERQRFHGTAKRLVHVPHQLVALKSV